MTKSFPIHIIDNGMALCREVRGWLEQAGHTVVCSQPTRALLTALAANPPGLVIVSMTNAADPGYDFYQRLSSHRHLRHLPVIVISEDPDLEYELLDVYDFQARPFDRARLLNSVARTSALAPVQLAGHFSVKQLDPFTELLNQHSGLHFSANNWRLLERGLQRRMQALQMTAPQRYFDYLSRSQDNQDEFNKLVGLLTVGETCFFRYRAHHDALVNTVLPALLERTAQSRRLRFWSAGCSTGEEPYSLAMKLLENFPQLRDWDVQILATDINKRSLRQAREGIYRERALRQVEPRYRERYFHQAGDHFILDQKVRSLVRFAYLNLQVGPFPDPTNGTAGLDLIFCRNVLIYFRSETMRKIVARFADCLNSDGYLLLGHAETLQYVSDRFQRHHQHGAFFYQLKTPQAVKPVSLPVRPEPAPPVSPPLPPVPLLLAVPSQPSAVSSPPSPFLSPVPPPDPEELYRQAMAAFDREEFAAAESWFAQVLALAPEHALALVGKGLLCANQGRHDEARQWCARAIRYDDLCPAAYLLRGLILDMEEQLERALVEYQKVLWLDRDFVMAHYLSAKIHGRLGQTEQQGRALRNAIRALEKPSATDIIPFS
ncbi:MAG: tetratricopeptide repeat protein, partial [Desulfuromonadales bacterium]|nr:tetratricopeptide repeat protein [Desulfuromonadales bacterium]